MPVPGLKKQGHSLSCNLVSILLSSTHHHTAAEKENYNSGRACLATNIDTEASGLDTDRKLRRFLCAAADTLAASNDLGKATRQLALCIRAMVCRCKKSDHCGINSKVKGALVPVSAAEFQLS